MFEFHGWATIRVDDADDPDMEILRRREESAMTRLRKVIREADDEFSHFDLRRTSNELVVLLTHGLRNHRYGPVIDLFKWVAAELPNSYGLLYVHDDEAVGQENHFRAWRLARGQFDELADPFLSPYIPMVESQSTASSDSSEDRTMG